MDQININSKKMIEEINMNNIIAILDEHSLIMQAILDIEGNFLKVPSGLCKLLGYTSEELLSKNIKDITHPEDSESCSKSLNKLMTGEIKTFEIEKRIYTSAGDMLWMHLNPTAYRDSSGEVKFFVTYITNITTRKAGEEILKEANKNLENAVNERTTELVVANNKLNKSKKQFHKMLEKLPAGAYMCNVEGLITYYNEKAVELWGRSPKINDTLEKFCGSFKLYIDGKVINHDECWMARALKEDKSFVDEIIHVERPDGEMKIVIANVSPLHDEFGKLVGAVNVLTDVTEKMNLEKEMKERQKQLVDFVENATIGLHWVGPDGIIKWANKYELDSLGYTREEYIGHNIMDFHADQDKISDILTKLTNNETLINYEAPLKCKNGSIKEVLINSSVYREDGKFIHTRCFTRDISALKKMEKELKAINENLEEKVKERTAELNSVIENYSSELTERKKAEQKLIKVNDELVKAQTELVNFEKLASLGRFSSGVAHELKNPLANISALAQLLNQKDIDVKLKKHLQYILENSVIANKIISDLLNFASPYEAIFRKENISIIVSSVCKIVNTRCEKNKILLSFNPGSNIPDVFVNEQKLQTAFMNFISNAIEAMPDGGTLNVSTSYIKELKEAEIIFEDSGCGINCENLDKIFEPFFTTKDEGTGLGLSMAYYVIKAHSGSIKFDSNDKGTKVIVKLPVIEELVV